VSAACYALRAVQDFEGKTAVVTGAASGIGFALAERFAREGMKVVLADVEAPALDAAVTKLRQQEHDVLGVLTDVSRVEAVEALAQRTTEAYGKVHVLCNNAGVAGAGGSSGPVWEKWPRDWQWAFGVNFWGVVNGVQAFLPGMLAHGEEGHVVNTASIAGVTSNVFGIYGVTKYAVVALSEYLYHSLRETNARIGASVLCPSFVATNLGTSDRNRPAELQSEVARDSAPPTWHNDPAVLNARDKRIEAAQAAEIVFEAIRENRFWIFTDREMDETIRARFEGMLARRNPGATLL
jgi:NAD(P)-dependent dehydrogenase (short-subunit alcohol dehydrogenase family)